MRELALHILEAGLNSLAAAASRVEVMVSENTLSDETTIIIADDGCGMDEQTAAHASELGFTTKPDGAGRGLALLRQHAEESGGTFLLETGLGEGTVVTASFAVEGGKAPIGDIPATICALVCAGPETEFSYTHVRDEADEFCMDTGELRQLMGAEGLTGVQFAAMVKQYLQEDRWKA